MPIREVVMRGHDCKTLESSFLTGVIATVAVASLFAIYITISRLMFKVIAG